MFALVPGSGIVFIYVFSIVTGISQINHTKIIEDLSSNSEKIIHITEHPDERLTTYLPIISKTLNLTITKVISDAANETETTKVLKPKTTKHKGNRKKGRRKRKNVQGALFTTEQILPENKTEHVNETHHVQRKRKRKNSKKRRQKQINNNNILEITTAKGFLSNHTNFDFTNNEIVQLLNKHPEQNIHFLNQKKKKIKSKFALSRNSSANLLIQGEEDNNAFLTINGTLTSSNSSISKTRKKYKKRFNRCRKKNGGCSQICNRKGKQKCSCLKGFFLTADNKTCEDIDECKIKNGGCQMDCVNNLGSYQCHCSPGLRIAYDMKSCIDVNECLLRNGHGFCQGSCKNTLGSYSCSCENLIGTKLAEDGKTCEDLDECLQDNGGCSHICINVFGTVYCSCPEGFELSSDWKTCQDINECEQNDHLKVCNHTCINTEGSYKCLESFNMLSDQQQPTNSVCKPLFLPKTGFINCSKDNLFTFYTRRGRKRITNSVGTNCKLVCPAGYRTVGEYDVTCGVDGEWIGNKTAKCVSSVPPTLECPPTQTVISNKGGDKVTVRFPSPLTNLHWKHIKSKPAWAKNLTGTVEEGQHDIMFFAKDPKSRLISSCLFKIIVEVKPE